MAWNKTACILCECNCGLEVELGGEDGRRLTKIRGDKAHPSSQGYACEKPHRLDYYQNNPERLTTPLRRRPDGTFEEIDWDTAIREVAERLTRVRDAHGGESIFYYGGGGQGNHLPGAYASATRRVLGSRYRSSALAQEKTGEFWVAERMMGTGTRADFEHCQVGVFIGKNPWQSHSFPRARVTLKEMARDPERTLIVIDPRRSETAAMADIHLAPLPGTDAWLLAAIGAVLLEEDLLDHTFVEQHTTGLGDVRSVFASLPIHEFCRRCGVEEGTVREVARLLAGAESVASFEDLGVQMNRHSTLVSYLHKLLWLLTGNLGKPGTHYIPTPMVDLANGSATRVSPVTGALIIGGMVPCNVIAEEILTDHPQRFRAMVIEAANPAHSLADSQSFRSALDALDTVVVIDVALTETARHADYVLPSSTQFEKAEATFFNFEFPKNVFHLRHPILPPPDGVLSEAEIHARLVEAMGALTDEVLAPLRAAAKEGREAFGQAFAGQVMGNPKLAGLAPVILFRTLGPTLPDGLAEGAALWGAAARLAMTAADSMARAGFDGGPLGAANAFLEALIAHPEGVVFAEDSWDEVRGRIKKPEGRIELALSDMLDEIETLKAEDPTLPNPDFPLVLSAGERRSFTANTIIRDPEWRKKDTQGALRMSASDAASLSVGDGERVRITTQAGTAEVVVEVSEMMRAGHVSLPNGTGLGFAGKPEVARGIAPNELTHAALRDRFAGTPWHKLVPARVEKLSA
ncbi:MAG: molybdopterin-dependent oxidoreductase [Myxococcota bacterium]